MQTGSRGLLIAALACAVLAVSAEPAHAYIDPGTTNMIIQAVAAAALTAATMVGVFWRAIKNFFHNLGNRLKKGASRQD